MLLMMLEGACPPDHNIEDAIIRMGKGDESAVEELRSITDSFEKADFCRKRVLASMDTLRDFVDKLESITATEYWPYPSYGDMLFSVK